MLTIQLLLCAAFVLSSETATILGENEVQEQLPVIGEIAEEMNMLPFLANGASKMREEVMGEGGVLEEGEEVEELMQEETFGMEVVNWRESRSSGCPVGWTNYGSRCFKFFNLPRTWSRAERYCVHYGANLASVHSSAEYHFLQNMIMTGTGDFTHIWLGGSDAVENQVWFWSDGARFDYQNWRIGEPNNAGSGEHCMMMNYGGEYRWNDISCGYSYAFICSLRLPADC